jgi:hypothetical protein
MIFDAQNLLSDGQAITVTAPSGNVLDLGATGTPLGGAAPLERDLGRSGVPLAVQVTESFAGLTSLAVAVQVSDDAGFSAPVTVLESGAVPAAELQAGYLYTRDWLPRGSDRRYLRLLYTVAGSAASAGRVTAGVVAALQQNP